MGQFRENSLKPCFRLFSGQNVSKTDQIRNKKDFFKYNEHRRIMKLLIFQCYVKNDNILMGQFRENSLKPCFGPFSGQNGPNLHSGTDFVNFPAGTAGKEKTRRRRR